MGDFMITKQESVSKGTRRVEAITGEYATNARDAFEELSGLVAAAAQLDEGERLDELKQLERRVVQTTLSTANRTTVDKMLANERKKLLAYEKEQQKKKQEKAVKDAEDLAQRLVGSEQRAIVLELEGDKAILQAVLKAFGKIAPEIAVCTVGTNKSADT